MTDMIHSQTTFHPVGQGLFVSGRITGEKSGRALRWVYDCGTKSGGALLSRAIQNELQSESSPIHILTLSHFHEDHYKGLPDLLQQHKVQHVMLPYVPLWDRLLVAFDRDVDPESPEFQIVTDPVGFFAANGDPDITFVRGEEGSAGEATAFNQETQQALQNGDYLSIGPETTRSSLSEQDAADLGVVSPNRTGTMRSGGTFQAINGHWEFVWYISPTAQKPPTNSPTFINHVTKLVTALRAAQGSQARLTAIKAIRKFYEQNGVLGKTNRSQNEISLHMYSGPCQEPPLFGTSVANRMEHSEHCGCRLDMPCCGLQSVGRVLLTGDGSLDDLISIANLKSRLGRNRSDRVGCLQVMHHGAAGYSTADVPKELKPCWSVFSCGEKTHPDSVVYDYYEKHGRLIVNDQAPFVILSRIATP